MDWCVLTSGRAGNGAPASQVDGDDTLHTKLDDNGHNEATPRRLVLNHLVYYGYAKTAEPFQASSRANSCRLPCSLPVPLPTSASAPAPGADSPTPPAGHENEGGEPNVFKQRIMTLCAIQRGDIEGALNDLRECFKFPDLLPCDGGYCDSRCVAASSSSSSIPRLKRSAPSPLRCPHTAWRRMWPLSTWPTTRLCRPRRRLVVHSGQITRRRLSVWKSTCCWSARGASLRIISQSRLEEVSADGQDRRLGMLL